MPHDDAPLPETAQILLLPSPAGLPEALTYALPAPLRSRAAVGLPALVPLGGREQLGYILAVGPGSAEPGAERLKPVKSLPRLEPAFDEEMLAVLRWVAREYRCGLSVALALAVPERHSLELRAVLHLAAWDGAVPERTGLISRQTLEALHAALVECDGAAPRDEIELRVNRSNFAQVLRRARAEGWVRQEYELLAPRVQARTLKGVRVAGETTPSEPSRLGPQQARLLERLHAEGVTRLQRDIQRDMGIAPDTVNRLQRRGLVEAVPVTVRRVPRGYEDGPAVEAPVLNPFQATAASAIRAATRRGAGESLLLFGVTGSGKTEVYLHAIQEARDAGRNALLLVPEISLTAQIAAAVRARLGEQVAILHSALSDGERFDEWERVRKGEADVVVGPRSALFAPTRRPALIILDEEHDGSYKQDRAPRYHARETAAERARLAGGCVVLGSATPSVESYHAATHGGHTLLELPERVRQRPLPVVEVVDLRAAPRRGNGVLSARLEDAIRRRLDAGEQVILFLNRRGYSPVLVCRDCGTVPRCPNCAVSLTLHHQDARSLLCHHCAYRLRAPDLCPHCLGHKLKPFGLGTQRVEESIRDLFPRAKVARLDRDAVATKDSHTRIIAAVANRDVDILIGTQMVSKGFDFPGVTLVGVVAADVALDSPDFRAGERAFQLLTQVSGRAGRGDQPGEVIVQTFKPEHPSIVAAARHDYLGFYATEIVEREAMRYPPFGSLVRFLSRDPLESAARERAETAAALLRPEAERCGAVLTEPAPCPLTRLKDRFRYHFCLRGPDREFNQDLLDRTWPRVGERVGGLSIDVEPVDML